MIVRVTSHRANDRLARVVPDRVELYLRSTLTSGYFEVPADSGADKIKGVTKARSQDRDAYGKAWKASGR